MGVCLTVIVVNAIELAAWTSLRWQWDFEPESDWEEWKLSALRVVFGLVFLYMLWSCVAALVGLVGALKVSNSKYHLFIILINNVFSTFSVYPVTSVSSGIAPLWTSYSRSFSPSLHHSVHPDLNLVLSFVNSSLANQNS